MPGGTAYYFSEAVSRLDINYLLVTALGQSEMRYVNNLRDKGIQIKVQPSTHTVCFENIYEADQDKRTQRVSQKADAFTMAELNGVDAKFFHLGPLLGDDFAVDIIKNLATRGKVSLDAQGYLREVINEQVFATDWKEKKAGLQYVDILKADEGELRSLTGYDTVADGVKALAGWGVKEAVITNGSKGSVIYADGELYHIPAYHPKQVIDATGCGDTYMAGYLYQRVKGAGIQQAGEFAAAMAGLKTTSPGAFTGTADDVAAFAASVQ